MTELLEIKTGTYVTPKLGEVYIEATVNLKLAKSGSSLLDDKESVGFLIEQGTITDFTGRTWEEGCLVYLRQDDIAVIHA